MVTETDLLQKDEESLKYEMKLALGAKFGPVGATASVGAGINNGKSAIHTSNFEDQAFATTVSFFLLYLVANAHLSCTVGR